MKTSSVWQILKTISVEPVIFCDALAITFHNVVYRFGIYHVICQKLYGDDPGVDCAHLSNSTYGNAPELAVQRAASDWSMQSALSYMIPATIADIMLGALGDRYGRKLNVLLGMFGMMMAVLPVAVLFGFPKTMPMYVLLIANVISGFTGFVSIVVISAYAYLADTVVDRDLLTVRMTLMQVCVNVGSIFGPLLASATSKVMTNSIQEVITLSLIACAFVVGLLVLRQVPPAVMRQRMAERHARRKSTAPNPQRDQSVQQQQQPSAADIDESTAEPKALEMGAVTSNSRSETPQENYPPEAVGGGPALAHSGSTGCCTPVLQILKACLALMKEIWATYTKPREGHIRAYILIASAVVFVSMAAEIGLRYSIFGQYVQKAPLSWDQDMIGYYDAANGAVTTAGTIAGVFVFKKLLGFTDTTVILIALVSGIAESLLIAFGTQTWMLFVSAVVGCLSSLVKPCVKSFVAKLVAADEVGKAFTIFGISQNVAYLLSAIIYNSIYKATLETFPGSVYVLAAVILVLIFVIVAWVHVDQKLAAGEKWHGMESLKAWVITRSTVGKDVTKAVQADVELTAVTIARS